MTAAIPAPLPPAPAFAPPFALNWQTDATAALLLMGLAFLTLAAHYALGATVGGIAVFGIALVSFLAAIAAPPFAFALMMGGMFLQSAFVATVAPLMPVTTYYPPLMASSFVSTGIMALVGAWSWGKHQNRLPAENGRLLMMMVYFFIVVALYSGLGIFGAPMQSVLVYARVYLIGGMMLILGVVFGSQVRPDYIGKIVYMLGAIMVAWGVAEFLWTDAVYRLFNIADFLSLKYANSATPMHFSIKDAIEYGNRTYLNLSGDFGLSFNIQRLKGPNLHSISYAYSLIFCGMLCFIYRAPVMMLMCFILALLVGAKGPLLMVAIPLLLYVFYQSTQNTKWLLLTLLGIMIVYTIGVFIYGVVSEDYHVVGLIGGIKGFFTNPIGRGVGIGGNMSYLGESQANFDLFQEHGAADFAIESAFGVMLYQIGIATVVFLAFYWTLWRNVWTATLFYLADQPRLIVIPAALAFLFVNSIFQEEALSPAGWGLWFLISGLLLGRYWSDLAAAAHAAPKDGQTEEIAAC